MSLFNRNKRKDGWIWYRIHWRRPVEVEHMRALLEKLASDEATDEIVFETRSQKDRLSYLLATRPRYAAHLERTFDQFANGTSLIKLGPSELEKLRPKTRFADKVTLGHPNLALNVDRTTMISRSILTAMASIAAGEHLVLQVMLGRRVRPFDVPKNIESPTTRLADRIFFPPELNRISSEMHAGLQKRHSMHGFQTEVRIGVATTVERFKNSLVLMDQIKDSLRMMETAGSNVTFSGKDVTRQLDNLIRPRIWKYALSSQEVSCLMAVPYGENDFPLVPPVHPITLQTHQLIPESTEYFAITDDPKRRIKFGINPAHSLRHTLLMGPSGVGKSTAMLNMILNDIKQGFGVLVIDPKDDLNTDILACMDKSRLDDVVVIDPMADHVVGINPLASKGDPDSIADGMLAVFREMFSSSWGQRTGDVLSNALATLTRTKQDVSLAMLVPLLTNPVFRRKLVDEVKEKDPIGLGSFWEQYEAMTPRKQQEIIAPLMNKLREFLRRPPPLRTIGQINPKFDLKDLFMKRKIILVSLNKSMLTPQIAKFLGSIILSQIWSLTQAQAAIPEAKRSIVKVYVDEMQDYLALPMNIADALSQARSYKVGFTLAHQYRDQVKDKELLAGIDANVAHKVFFSLNDPDARTIANMCNILSPEDFKYLKRYHVYVQTLCLGQTTWLSAKTKSKPQPINNAETIKQQSLKLYGRPVAEVDQEQAKAVNIYEDIEEKLRRISFSKPLVGVAKTAKTILGQSLSPNTSGM